MRKDVQLWIHGGKQVLNSAFAARFSETRMTVYFKLFILLETGGIFIAPRPSADNSTPKPEFATRPFFGVEPVLLDSEVPILIVCLIPYL